MPPVKVKRLRRCVTFTLTSTTNVDSVVSLSVSPPTVAVFGPVQSRTFSGSVNLVVTFFPLSAFRCAQSCVQKLGGIPEHPGPAPGRTLVRGIKALVHIRICCSDQKSCTGGKGWFLLAQSPFKQSHIGMIGGPNGSFFVVVLCQYNGLRAKKRDMGYSEEELEESYGFMLLHDINQVQIHITLSHPDKRGLHTLFDLSHVFFNVFF